MSILVTGGAGVIGSNVVRELLQSGQEVVVFDAREDRSLLGNLDVAIEVGDICDLSQLEDILRRRKVEKIAHLAAVMPDWAKENPYQASRINTWGLVSVLEAAKNTGVPRVVFTSSKAAIGSVDSKFTHPSYLPVGEDVTTHPNDVYGATKLASEILGTRLAKEFGIELVILRLASTYGPGKTVRHGKVGILSKIIEGAFRGESIRIDSGADQKNDFLYCKDIAQAVNKSLEARIDGVGLFHIGSGRISSLRDFVESVKSHIEGADIEIGDGLDYGGGVGQYFLMDITKARDGIGYVPQYDIDKGIADYVKTLSQSGQMN